MQKRIFHYVARKGPELPSHALDELEWASDRITTLEKLLAEWTNDESCGCDTFTCTELCLPARCRTALEETT